MTSQAQSDPVRPSQVQNLKSRTQGACNIPFEYEIEEFLE